MSKILERIINISAQSKEKVSIKESKDITFDKGFYLENIWNSMAFFLGIQMREKNSNEIKKQINIIII